MAKSYGLMILCSIVIGLAAKGCWGASTRGDGTLLVRDRTYEEDLRWQASEDRTITPARVLRWMNGMRGAAVFASVTPAEFQPIVNVENAHIRLVATIAYKF